ncbi:MAG: CHAT domain-containing protein, partial [Bacteroidales bacterium]|nr:CHAT domain-containing protein [Bacteroidales bacterium]
INKGLGFEEDYLAQYYKSLTNQNDNSNQIENQHNYQNFWQQIEERLDGKDKVYVCLDGMYHKINLNTILCPDGKYLCDKTNLTILNSTTELLYRNKNITNTKNIALLAGNPDFSLNQLPTQEFAANISGTGSTSDFDPIYRDFNGQTLKALPGSQFEVEQINEILLKNKWTTYCFTGKEALEQEIKSIKNPGIIHLATHGFFARDNGFDKKYNNPMLQSGLMLCGSQNYLSGVYDPQETNDDGILTGFEVAGLNLDSTGLVVLSACETGLGEIKNGEGVYGLQRAFKIAGAKNIIMSLWKVDDNATQILMRKFYEFWLNGNSKKKAFELARDHLRNNTEYKSPFYWGGFVFIGIDDPIEKSFVFWWYFLLFLILPSGFLIYRKIYKKH